MTRIRTLKGLTLIELMVTIAIVAILAGIAIPSYSRYTTSASRTAAKTALEIMRSKMRSYYNNNKAYTTNATDLGFNASPVMINKAGEENAADAVYSIAIMNPGGCTLPTCYAFEATPVGGQAANDTDCLQMRLTLTGDKSATGPKGDACWN